MQHKNCMYDAKSSWTCPLLEHFRHGDTDIHFFSFFFFNTEMQRRPTNNGLSPGFVREFS